MPRQIFLQPGLPSYRVPFFDYLATGEGAGVVVYASDFDLGLVTTNQITPTWWRKLGRIRSIFGFLIWQSGTLAIKIEKDDIVIVSGAPRYVTNLLFFLRAKRVGAKTIWWSHFVSGGQLTLLGRLRLAVGSTADAMLFYTDRELEEYHRSLNPRRGQVFGALNNGIDTNPALSLRKRYVSQDRARRILFIGRATKKAEFEILLQALADDRCQDVLLAAVGVACGDWAPVARHLGVSERVSFHGVVTDESEIALIANECRLFVYPGAVGLSLIHALAYGLPAIIGSGYCGHMPEAAAFEAGGNGVCFVRGDSGSLAATIAKVIQDEALLDRLSAGAVESVAVSFNVEDMVKRYRCLVQTLTELSHD